MIVSILIAKKESKSHLGYARHSGLFRKLGPSGQHVYMGRLPNSPVGPYCNSLLAFLNASPSLLQPVALPQVTCGLHSAEPASRSTLTVGRCGARM